MQNKSPAFQFYPKDWLSDGKTMALPLFAKGCYVTLLCYDWTDDGITDDSEKWKYMIGGDALLCEDWEKVVEQLISLFVSHPDKKNHLTNPRLYRERQKQTAYSESKKRAGKAGAKRRWQSHDSANSKPITNDSFSSSSSTSSSDVYKPKKKSVDLIKPHESFRYVRVRQTWLDSQIEKLGRKKVMLLLQDVDDYCKKKGKAMYVDYEAAFRSFKKREQSDPAKAKEPPANHAAFQSAIEAHKKQLQS